MNKLSASVLPEEEQHLYRHIDPEMENHLEEVKQLMHNAMEKTYCGCCERTPTTNPGKLQMEAAEKVLCRCEKIYMIPVDKKQMEKRKKHLAAALLAGTLMTALIVLIVVLVKYA
jgi:hypothetical protein